MRKQEGKMIRTQGESGLIVYHDAEEEITEKDLEKIRLNMSIGNSTLQNRFALATSKLKTFVGAMNEDFIDGVGLPLTSVVKEIESDLNEISNFIEKTLGDILLLYHNDGGAYGGYMDEHVVGLAFRPADARKKG